MLEDDKLSVLGGLAPSALRSNWSGECGHYELLDDCELALLELLELDAELADALRLEEDEDRLDSELEELLLDDNELCELADCELCELLDSELCELLLDEELDEELSSSSRTACSQPAGPITKSLRKSVS